MASASLLCTTFMLTVLLLSCSLCYAFPGFDFGWGGGGGGGGGGGDVSFGGGGGGRGGDVSFGGGQGYSGLFPEFYSYLCPQANDIVMSVLESVIPQDPRMAASLLRLHFHDCFVQGCDASVLLDDSEVFASEKNSVPNSNSIRGFEVIDEIKSKLEEECPETVSCADILALAARGSTVLSGGPNWELPLGRRDATQASLSGSNNNLPPPNSTIQNLITLFRQQGLDEADLVSLSGAHTIGMARCTSFKQRLYNQPDSTLEVTYYNGLKTVCPEIGGDNNISPLDFASPARFDNTYFKLIMLGKGLLTSDQVLLSGNVEETMFLVKAFAEDDALFFDQFARSMVKMGSINPLTGYDGEVRKNCRMKQKKKVARPSPPALLRRQKKNQRRSPPSGGQSSGDLPAAIDRSGDLPAATQRRSRRCLFVKEMEPKKLRTNWKKEGVDKTFLELCIHEVALNGGTLKPASWRIIGEKMKKEYDFEVDQKKMKNKYDHLKRRFTAWSKLKNKTGNVYDPVKNMFNLSEEEWQLEIKSNKNVESLRTTPLEYPELCIQLFEGSTSTGVDSWGPSSTLPRDSEEVFDDNEYEDIDDNEMPLVVSQRNKTTPPSQGGSEEFSERSAKRKSSSQGVSDESPIRPKKGKAKETFKSKVLEVGNSINKVANMMLEKHNDMNQCLQKLKTLGWGPTDARFKTSLLLFGESADMRKVFLGLEEEHCELWVKMAGAKYGMFGF
ncbi:hypothetical protein SSX86_013983 [Deinandra increscens subsp. villosa]|uniref:peroxidase n=1 Tax=Deinandra increscens subsp. villosa TaxID=3103831 RepID=A0AAP0H1P1_9ASTR